MKNKKKKEPIVTINIDLKSAIPEICLISMLEDIYNGGFVYCSYLYLDDGFTLIGTNSKEACKNYIVSAKGEFHEDSIDNVKDKLIHLLLKYFYTDIDSN